MLPILFKVPNLYFFYTTAGDANYFVDIDSVFDLKLESVSRHVSQFEPALSKYRADWEPDRLAKLREAYRTRHERRNGRYVESFRFATGFNPR